MEIFRVEEKEAVIIERWDHKYMRTETRPGIHVKSPAFYSKIVARISTEIFEDAFDVKIQTNDQVYATVPVILHLSIQDPRGFHYNAKDPMEKSRAVISDALKKLCSVYSLEELRGKAILQPSLQNQIGEPVLALYGIKIVKALIGMADPGQDILDAIHRVNVTAKEAAAQLNLARAESATEVMMAEARNASLRAEVDVTVSKFRELVESGMSEEVAAQFLMASVKGATLRRMAQEGHVLVSDEQGRFVNNAAGILPAAAIAVPHGLAPLGVAGATAAPVAPVAVPAAAPVPAAPPS